MVNDLKKNGVKLTKNDIQAIWKKISKANKKNLEISQYASDYIESEIDIGIDEYMLQCHKDKQKEDKDELPIKVEIGVTIALCGFFLSCVPYPACTTSGRLLMAIGGEIAGDGIMTRMQEHRDRERDNREKYIIG